MELPPIFQKFKLEGIATTHQANVKYGKYAGSQCLSNCVIYLASSYFNSEIPVTSTHDLDRVLELGSRLDFLIRRSGFLGENQYAQLHHIPAFIHTSKWSCNIYKSQELFGMIEHESIIRESFIISLKSLLTKQYGNMQYFLFICGEQAGAIIIKNNTFFVFNPHCIRTLPGSPAHVLSTKDIQAVLTYIASPGAEYTGTFLYIVPREFTNPHHYITSRYGAFSYEPLRGANIDLALGFPEEATLTEVEPSPPPQTNVSRPQINIVPSGHPKDIDTAPKKDPPQPQYSKVEDLLQALTSVKRKRTSSDTTSSGELDQPDTKHTESSPPEDDLWFDDSLPPQYSPTLSEDLIFSPEGRLNSEIEVNMDNDGFYTENIESEATATSIPSASIFLQIDELIDTLDSFNHVPDAPQVIDKNTKRPYREAMALKNMDRILTSLILEYGMISSKSIHGISQCKTLLQFCILWAQRLEIPTHDLTLLLNSDLQIPRICILLQGGKFKQESFISHIIWKLNPCLSKLHSDKKGLYSEVINIIHNASNRINVLENETNIKHFRSIFSDTLGDEFYMICTPDEVESLHRELSTFKKKLEHKNTDLHNENKYFDSVLLALENFQVPPEPIVIQENNTQKKMERLLSVLTNIQDRFTQNIQILLAELLETIEASSTDITEPPDFNTILMNIENTINLIEFCKSHIKLDTSSLTTTKQQLLYLGGEVANIVNAPWPFETPPPISPLPIINQAKSKLKEMQQRSQTNKALDHILSEAETILESLQSGNTKNNSTPPISISILENYVASAGAILNDKYTARFNRLRDSIQKLTNSENLILDLINSTRLSNLLINLPKITDVLDSNPHIKISTPVKHTLTGASDTLTHEILELLRNRDVDALPANIILAYRTFIRYADYTAHEELGQLIEGINQLQRRTSHAVNSQLPVNDIIEDYGSLQSELSTANLQKSLKREIHTIIINDNKYLNTYQGDLQYSDWKRKVKSFYPKYIREAINFIDAAPTTKAKQYAKRALAAKMAALKQKPPEKKNDPSSAVEPMDQSNSPLPSKKQIDAQITANANNAWMKIKTAFNNWNFEIIDPKDWEDISTEYARPGSPFPTVFGPGMLKLVQGVYTELAGLITNKLASMCPLGRPFNPPQYDWISSYDTHVNFYLKNINLPSIHAISENICKDINILKQAMNANSLEQATVGTQWEQPTHIYLEVLKKINQLQSDHIMDSNSMVHEYIESLKLRTKDTPLPQPDIQHTPSLLTPDDTETIKKLPEIFRLSIIENEKHLISIQEKWFILLKNDVQEAKKQYLATQEEIAMRLFTTLTNTIPQAPIIISSRQISKTDPIQFLVDAVHDKSIIERAPYSVTLAALTWLEVACKSLLSVCPTHLKYKLNQVLGEVQAHKDKLQPLYDLENEANTSDDINRIKLAISTLDHNRVTNGKVTVDAWVKKCQHIENILGDIATLSSFQAAFLSIANQATGTTSTTHLNDLSVQASKLLDKANESKIQDKDRSSYLKIKELILYITFKLKFLLSYERNQPEIFQKFPLSQQIPGPKLSSPLDNELRLKLYIRLKKEKSIFLWLESLPNVDKVTPVYIPIKNAPPLHWTIIFSNFLEPTALQHRSLNHATPVTSNPLPGISKARVGIETSALFAYQWESILQLARETLTAYKENTLTPLQKNNKFLGMIILGHILSLGTKEMQDTGLYPPDAEVIFLNHIQWIRLLMSMWPHFLAATTRKPTFMEALKLLRTTISYLFYIGQYNSLENKIGPAMIYPPDPLNSFPWPQALLFTPSRWQPINIAEAMWLQPKFLQFCNNNSQRARICLIQWAIDSIDTIVLSQLWESLKPLDADNGTTYHDLLALIVNLNFREISPLPRHEPVQEQTPYIYGNTTGNALICPPQEFYKNEPNIPLTAFEIAIGSILFKVPVQMFLASSTPLATSARWGDISLISPLLDCTGITEPFKSLLQTPINPPRVSTSIGAITNEELQLFTRQATWLTTAFTQTQSPSPTTPIVVTLDLNNHVINSYLPPQDGFTNQYIYHLVPGPLHKQWPTDIITTASGNPASTPKEVLQQYLETVKAIEDVPDMFAKFPPELQPALPDKAYEQSDPVTPTQSQTPPQLQTHPTIPPPTDHRKDSNPPIPHNIPPQETPKIGITSLKPPKTQKDNLWYSSRRKPHGGTNSTQMMSSAASKNQSTSGLNIPQSSLTLSRPYEEPIISKDSRNHIPTKPQILISTETRPVGSPAPKPPHPTDTAPLPKPQISLTKRENPQLHFNPAHTQSQEESKSKTPPTHPAVKPQSPKPQSKPGHQQQLLTNTLESIKKTINHKSETSTQPSLRARNEHQAPQPPNIGVPHNDNISDKAATGVPATPSPPSKLTTNHITSRHSPTKKTSTSQPKLHLLPPKILTPAPTTPPPTTQPKPIPQPPKLDYPKPQKEKLTPPQTTKEMSTSVPVNQKPHPPSQKTNKSLPITTPSPPNPKPSSPLFPDDNTPSVKMNVLTIEDIETDPNTLIHPFPNIVQLMHVKNKPIIPLPDKILDITTAKETLMTFIDMIKHTIIVTTESIINTINRLKQFYL
nr:tegument protein [Bovine gammaherpesvirus 4]